MPSSSIESVREGLARQLVATPGVVDAYLFGSALRRDDPKDVDVIVVYDEPLGPQSVGAAIRPLVREIVSAELGIPAHVVLLTRAEAAESGMIRGFAPESLFGSAP